MLTARVMEGCMMCPLCLLFFLHVNSACGCTKSRTAHVWVEVHACPHWPCVVMCVLLVTQCLFLCVLYSDIVPTVSRALEYAGCFCCPPGCSAFLALSYNGALEHGDAIKPFKLLQLEFQLSGKTSILDVDYMARNKSLRNNSKD